MTLLISDALDHLSAARRGFLSLGDIKRTITSSKNYRLDGTPPEAARALLIFSTSRQQTWLVATSQRLYCILDDLATGEATVNWSMGRDALVASDGTLKIKLQERPYKDRTWYVDFGDAHTDWLFSRSLFAGRSIEDAVRDLLREQMGAR